MTEKLVVVATVTVAAGILVLILIPVSIWRHPTTDATYRGFDRNLIAISAAGTSQNTGKVDVSSSSLTITAGSGSHPTVHLVTTPLSFATAFDVELTALPTRGVPLRIGVWNPAVRAGYFLIFDHDHGDVIRDEVITQGDASQDLTGGLVVLDHILGPFTTGQPYHVAITLDELGRALRSQVTGGSLAADTLVDPDQAPDLFNAFRPTLTLSAFPDDGTSVAVVSNYVVTIPSQPSFTAEETVRIIDSRATLLVWIGLVASLALCLLAAFPWVAEHLNRLRGTINHLNLNPGSVKGMAATVLLLGSAAGAYLLANSLLFGLASPHFEIVASKAWSYVAFQNGITDLYYRTLLVPAADAWRGSPVHEATFSYGFTKAYYYLAAAWAYLPWSPSGRFTVKTYSFEVLLKILNVIFGLIDAALVYLILKRFVSRTNAQGAALLFALNPALIMVMSLWGSTETISLFFVFSSILAAEKQKPLAAWALLVAGAFTRPQMLVFAFLLGAVYLRKFGAGRNLLAIARTALVSFIGLAPFSLSISPSVPVDYVTRILAFHVGNQQADIAYLGLSPANYSVWTLPMLLVSGEHGLQRMWSPSTMPFIGSISYGQVGGALSIGLILLVGAVLLIRSNLSAQPGLYLPLVSFGLLGWMLVTPGAMSRYMIYPIAALILCRAVFSSGAYYTVLGTLIAIACITIYGHLANDFLGYSGSTNVLSPTNNPTSHLLFSLFSADWFINLAAMANIAVLVSLGFGAWASLRTHPAERTTPAAAVAAT